MRCSSTSCAFRLCGTKYDKRLKHKVGFEDLCQTTITLVQKVSIQVQKIASWFSVPFPCTKYLKGIYGTTRERRKTCPT